MENKELHAGEEIQPLQKRGAVIPVSYALISDILSREFGIDMKVTGAESLYYHHGIGFAVETDDKTFPVVEEGVRLKEVRPMYKTHVSGEPGKLEYVRQLEGLIIDGKMVFPNE